MRFIEFLIEQPKDLAQHNDLDNKSSKYKLRDMYKDKDIGRKTKVTAQSVEVKDSKTGKIYGRRSFHQK